MSTLEAEAPAPTRAQTYERFKEIVAALREQGWDNLRVDTLVHPHSEVVIAKPFDPTARDRGQYSVRHHYSGDTWELHYEIDRPHWSSPRGTHRMVRLTVGRPLLSVEAAISELFGPDLRHYVTAD